MDTPIHNASGERLEYAFAAGSGPNPRRDWLVVLGHGVTGNLNRPIMADTARALNTAGFDTLRFSFSGNGNSEGDFRAATISKEVGDLNAVIDAAAAAYPNIAYIGHSMGCAVGVLQAARDPRIQCLVSLSGMVDTKAFAQTEFGEETPDAGLMWEEEDCPLSSDFMTDLCETIVSVEPQVKAVQCPWLLLHGTADDVVQRKDTELVQSLRGDDVKVVFVEGSDHSYSAPEHKALATQTVAAWLSAQADRDH